MTPADPPGRSGDPAPAVGPVAGGPSAGWPPTRPPLPPLYLLAGAPGAGKTTLLPHLVAALHGVVVLDMDELLEDGTLLGVPIADPTAAPTWPAYGRMWRRIVAAVRRAGGAVRRFGCKPRRMESKVRSVQPELWVDSGTAAVEFYRAAFGARVLYSAGAGDDIVAQLAVGNAIFWIAATDSSGRRLVPRIAGAASGRMLLVADDPDAVHAQAVAAGATVLAAVSVEHGWRIGRIVDPFGQEWEIGTRMVPWPPGGAEA